MALDIVAWHDRTSSDHQTQYNNARAAGYSTVSLCVYGDPGNPLYAAAMVKRAHADTRAALLAAERRDPADHV